MLVKLKCDYKLKLWDYSELKTVIKILKKGTEINVFEITNRLVKRAECFFGMEDIGKYYIDTDSLKLGDYIYPEDLNGIVITNKQFKSIRGD